MGWQGPHLSIRGGEHLKLGYCVLASAVLLCDLGQLSCLLWASYSVLVK